VGQNAAGQKVLAGLTVSVDGYITGPMTGPVRASASAASGCTTGCGRHRRTDGLGGFAGWAGSARIVHDDEGACFEIVLA
jgi:hypothetical protein